VSTYLPLARHDWETASTYSFPFYFIHPPSCSAAYKISALSVYSQPERIRTQSYRRRFGPVGIPNPNCRIRPAPPRLRGISWRSPLHQRKKSSSHSSTLPKTAITYVALVCSLTARSNELIHSEFKWIEFWMGECPQSHAPL